MPASKKLNLLVNLPPGTFKCAELKKDFARLAKLGTIRKTSHNRPEEIHNDAIWANAIVMWAWPDFAEQTVAAAKGLRWVGCINSSPAMQSLLAKYKVAHSESRHCWSPAVAEMALGLMIDGLRAIGGYHIAMRQGAEGWDTDFPLTVPLNERELTGRRVGIVGFGGIGQRLSRLLAPFHVELRVHDPFVPAKVLKEHNTQHVPMLELAKKSEVLVLCAANTATSKHILGAREIAALSKNAVLVNVGRSYLVDMPALEKRLAKNDMTAMLDVFEKEPLEADSVLRKLPNVFLTPHRAGGLFSSIHRAFDQLTGDLENVLARKPLKYPMAVEKTGGKALPG